MKVWKMDQELCDFMKNFHQHWLEEQQPKPGMLVENWEVWWKVAMDHEVRHL